MITQIRAEDDIRRCVESVGRAMPGIEVKIENIYPKEIEDLGRCPQRCFPIANIRASGSRVRPA